MEVKVQCGCGMRYAFDVEPVNGQMPATIFCPTCGTDGTAFANTIIREKLAQQTVTADPEKSRLRVSGTAVPRETAPSAPISSTTETQIGFCHRHSRTAAAARCVVCQKPICPACMSQFGYLCSVSCRYQAEQRRLPVPVYEGQRNVVEANWWRKAGLISGLVGLVIVGLIGTWFWYISIGSQPRPMYSLKFSEKETPTHAQFLEKDRILLIQPKQLVVHDFKSKKDVWIASLSENTAAASAERKTDETKAAANDHSEDSFLNPYDEPKIHLTKDQIWICLPKQIISFEKETGAAKHNIPLPGQSPHFFPSDRWISVISQSASRKKMITRVELSTGEVQSEEVAVTPVEHQFIADEIPPNVSPTAAYLLNHELATNEERQKALKKVFSEFIPTGINAVEMQVRLVEQNLVPVASMKKAGPSSLNAETSAATSAGVVAEEIFNELKRNKTGGMKMVDESRYAVKIRRLLGSGMEPWSGEVTGPPVFFSQRTVDLLVAGRGLHIFDKQNKKLHEARLTYTIGEEFAEAGGAEGPAVEIADSLYFFDQGVLTAFTLPGCEVRWRLTTVGVSRVQPDESGHLYINTTTASPEDIQYSEQIKITDKTYPVLIKVDAKSGTILWKSKSAADARLSGKYVYAMSERTGGMGLLVGLQDALGTMNGSSPIFRLYRISPKNGKRLWEFDQQSAPVQIDFRDNHILMLNDKEVTVLKYWTF